MKVGERSQKVLEYLEMNGTAMDSKDEFMQVHVEELGSRLMMDVRAGALVMPVFVYNPTANQINNTSHVTEESIRLPKPTESKTSKLIEGSPTPHHQIETN